jgi:transcriptional regulator with XRE-family HTH domain
VTESLDLRTILSQNIKNARGTLHITQAKLAEYADISLSSVIDIERCRTWVSDKTLLNIAKALNMEAYQLLVPVKQRPDGQEGETHIREQITALIHAKKIVLRKIADESMDDLALKILRLYAEEPRLPG